MLKQIVCLSLFLAALGANGQTKVTSLVAKGAGGWVQRDPQWPDWLLYLVKTNSFNIAANEAVRILDLDFCGDASPLVWFEREGLSFTPKLGTIIVGPANLRLTYRVNGGWSDRWEGSVNDYDSSGAMVTFERWRVISTPPVR